MVPLLFLDVDGVLLPFGSPTATGSGTASLDRRVTEASAPGLRGPDNSAPDLRAPSDPMRAGRPMANPLLARLDPDHGRRLSALGCELVWATSWMSDANDVIAPALGLRALPVVAWPDEDEDEAGGRHWKTRTLVDYAAGRPFVWLDDEIGDIDRRWVATHHPGPALLHRTDPRTGLTPADLATVTAWLLTSTS